MISSTGIKRHKEFHPGKAAVYFILALWTVTAVFPFVWVIGNSFKPSSEVVNTSFSLPRDFTLKNYTNAFGKQNILESYKNSLLISGTVMAVTMFLASMMAFAMTRYQFKGKAAVNAVILSSLMIPAFSTVIPVFKRMGEFGLLNLPISVILPQVAGNLSFATVVMMGFMRGIPSALEEAAYMEGAGVGKVFAHIIIPLSRPSIATASIFCFLWSYNDMLTQLIMIRKRSRYPIGVLLNEISSKYGTDYGLMAASVTLIIVPVLIVYVFLQKYIMKGLTAGALKG